MRLLPAQSARPARAAAARAAAPRAAASAAAASAAAPSAPPRPAAPRAGDVLELDCVDLAFGGDGVCKAGPGAMAVFVPRAVPGERLSVVVLESKGAFARGAKLETRTASPAAAAPACAHFDEGCGGCALQGMSYDAQVAAKGDQVRQLLSRFAGAPPEATRPARAAPAPLGYR
jgi:tRNA/tmRNA/rRNA uracil-C5-methylase (TrmA/RlmC/RlmD family)